MAESNNTPKNEVFSENDTLDINELASLNNDISADFIEQLQNQVSQSATQFAEQGSANENDDANLFEEVPQEQPESVNALPQGLDDDFAKKYRAKLNNQPVPQEQVPQEETETQQESADKEPEASESVQQPIDAETKEDIAEKQENTQPEDPSEPQKPIENLTGGNIVEKPVSDKQIEYNQSLKLLDNNVPYSKYVIYIDPENKDFIDSLTVKERKNLINRIIREQDDIAVTKRRLNTVQTVIKHAIIAIITVTLSVPVIYAVFNASLEATINNQRRSQTLFQTLYREHGKIKTNSIK